MLHKQKNRSRFFHVQDDGRFGAVHTHSDDASIDQFMILEHPSSAHGRGPVPLSTSVQKKRIRIGILMMVSVLCLFLGRSAQLQVWNGNEYAALSNQNRVRVELIVPARGIIYDRFGKQVAWNEPLFILTMTASQLPKGDERQPLFEQVSELIGILPTDLDLLLAQYSDRLHEPVPVMRGIPYESAMRLAVQIADLSGFELATSTQRVYTSSAKSLSHILGYTGVISAQDLSDRKGEGYRLIDSIGRTGVERVQESLLRGVPGRLVYEVDAQGRNTAILSKEDPVAGSNVTLSIDTDFQKFIEQQLTNTLERVNAHRGTVVALDPRSGAVRALVSLPSYDANEFVGGISYARYQALLENEHQPLFFRGISGDFPSGSTFKPFVVYAALLEGIVSEHTSFVSSGGLRIGQWFFPDWKAGGHGVTNARKAISESVNTYFYIIGGGYDTIVGLGIERIDSYARLFGFGSPTGIDLPNEGDGFIPSKEWKQQVKGERWYVGDTYHVSIGQGDFLTTPLQMAVATAAIANGGKRVIPYVAESADGMGANMISHDQPIEIDGLNASALTIVRQGMRDTVTSGSAQSLSNLVQDTAGKTGTAQTTGDRPYHSWFTGFGPFDESTLTLVVLIEEGGESNDSAVPLARSIFEWWYNHN